MKIIGVTGGVGAGKSTVLNYLEKRYGAKLILADLVGHEVMEPGHEAYEQVVKAFGQEIVSEDKTIDRKILGAIVFADEKKRMILNRIIIRQCGRKFCGGWKRRNYRICYMLW